MAQQNNTLIKDAKPFVVLTCSILSSIYYLIHCDNDEETQALLNWFSKSFSTSSLTYYTYLKQQKKITSLSLGVGAHCLGDSLLAIDQSLIIESIPFFMLGHLLYSYELSKYPFDSINNIFQTKKNKILLLCAFALLINTLLLSNVPEMLGMAIPIYTLALLSTSLLESCLISKRPCLSIGFLSYIASDSLIAIDTFIAKIPKSNYLTWFLYYNAQLLITHTLMHTAQIRHKKIDLPKLLQKKPAQLIKPSC